MVTLETKEGWEGKERGIALKGIVWLLVILLIGG